MEAIEKFRERCESNPRLLEMKEKIKENGRRESQRRIIWGANRPIKQQF
jgi:hypothetical protein